MHDKIQRYSLRKLSVGLASVMVGACIFSVNGKTVKADVTSDQTTQATNVQGQTATAQAQSNDAQNEKQQTSSDQNSVADQSQKNLLDDLDKQKTSTQSGDQAEAKNQENRLVDQINYKLTSDNNTDNKEDLGQNKVAPDETKQAPITKSDVEKSIVGSSSAQKVNNQSNDHADDNSQTQNEQKLDLTKNSKKLAKKVLATNLTQDNSTQDISQITDPSKIDASHFADGTHWTPAGWTRTDKNTKVAKSSNFDIKFSNPENIDKTTNIYTEKYQDGTFINPVKIDFTIDKNDMKVGNKILVATIQQVPTNAKQNLESNKQPSLGSDTMFYIPFVIKDTNQNEIGRLTVSNLDNGEDDIYFIPATTMSNLITDPHFSYTFPSVGTYLDENNAWGSGNYGMFYSYKNNLHFPLAYSGITNSSILNYQINLSKNRYTTAEAPDKDQWSTSADPTWETFTFNYWNIHNQTKEISPSMDVLYKLTIVGKNRPTEFGSTIQSEINILDANGNPTGEKKQCSNNPINLQKTTDNLTTKDLWDQTPDGSGRYSFQSDGSVFICIKAKTNKPTSDEIKNAVSTSFVANVQDPTHYEQILNNTLTKTTNNSEMHVTINQYGLDPTSSINEHIVDLTPQTVRGLNVNDVWIKKGDNTGSSISSDTEIYKNVKISYIDDDATDQTKSNISSDTMTGRQNKASTYTVNIPKGYYLDDNNTSTGYTWNADHTAISYTFNKDQAKNDANPIEIHLKHKHTAITDSSQLQTTGKRTITITLPHQDKPMIIVQTVGYKRTGDLDEATNTPTYTDWVFDADTSNVTVNGQVSTQYQAYVLKDGVVNYAPIKLPHINGYKVKLIQDKANPAMFMVSFVALPQQNNQSNNVQSSQKPAQPEQNQPEPIQTKPADDKEVAQILNHIAFELMHNSSSNADSFEPAQNDSDQLETPSDSTQKDDAAKPQKVNAAKHKKHIVKKRVVKRHKKHAKKYHLKRRSRKHTKCAKKRSKRIIKHRKSVSRKFRKHNLKHVKKN